MPRFKILTFHLVCVVFSFGFSSFSQVLDPVNWNTYARKISEGEYELLATATIEKSWHLYGQEKHEDGPIPTSFSYDTEGVEFLGKTEEDAGHVVDDPTFGIRLKYFDDIATFRRRVKVSEGIHQIIAEVEYMACNDRQCTPPTHKDLVFKIGSDKDLDTVSYHRGSDSGRGLWLTFVIAFLSGITALFTPCVFPMIPLTVSFFSKTGETKSKGIYKAIVYGLFIVVIYVFLGAVVSAIFGADALNALSTNVWFNLFFFLVLTTFAISLMGAFEIRLPGSWSNKIDTQSNRKGLLGIFFMALALVIVSFSCTGPIVGTLLVEFSIKGGMAPIIGMLGYALAFALPFGIFATFPGLMQSLPKSGGWLNTVKVVLGFLELALAFKFLSNADLVLQMHLLEREIFLVIWISIFATLTLYLFGKIQLSHDSTVRYISTGRLCFGMLTFAFTLYMISGLAGAPLRKLAAFLPPENYGEAPKVNSIIDNSSFGFPKETHPGPHGLRAFHDYDEGMSYAEKVGKPLFVDFTGHACVNCRKMENSVWADSGILNILKNDVVLVSLYVDDKRPLPEKYNIVSAVSGKKLKYIGQRWSDFQISKYGINAQPFYVLEDHRGKPLTEPISFEQDVNVYYNWLTKGIRKFNLKKK